MPEITKPSGLDIVVDHRESRNHVFSHLKDLDVNLKKEQLKAGDYICSDRVIIERKTTGDFLQSIMDQRIFRQAFDMRECYEIPLLILEGSNEELFFERNVHPNTIRGVLSSLAIDYRIPIIWTRNPKETADQIYWIAYREQIKEKRGLAVRCPKKLQTLGEQQEFLVSGLPQVNSKLSKNLLEKFKTPKRIFSAKPEKLMKVDGIGKSKAKKIWELLNGKYE